jgi:hypothetical protein
MPNGMDRSCAATIYPVLDKPHNSEALGPRGLLLKDICPLVFQIPFTIRPDRRKKCLLHGSHGLKRSVNGVEPASL